MSKLGSFFFLLIYFLFFGPNSRWDFAAADAVCMQAAVPGAAEHEHCAQADPEEHERVAEAASSPICIL